MANIYNDNLINNSLILPPAPTFTSITTSNINIPTSAVGDLLFIDSSKNIDGLAIAPQNYLVQSSGSFPQYTNNISVNTTTTNSIKINGSTPNALLSIDNSNFVDEILPTTPGDILQVNTGGQFISAPLTLPNPLFLQGLQINLPDGILFINNTNVLTEKPQFVANPILNNITLPTQLFFNTFNTVPGNWYKYTTAFDMTGEGDLNLTVGGLGIVRTFLSATTGSKEFSYIFQGGAATVDIYLELTPTTISFLSIQQCLLTPLGIL
jgi:hypothetical protein